MRKPLTIGVLAESKNKWERRAPLTPQDITWFRKRKIPVEVQTSALRIFKDSEYKKAGARIVSRFKSANLIVGVKEPPLDLLVPQSVCCVFSHTVKGQRENEVLLRETLRKKITLVDYECIRSKAGDRLVYFGRFAGICGALDTLHFLGKKLEARKIKTPFSRVKRALDYGSWKKAYKDLLEIAGTVKAKGYSEKITPLIFGITGHGNVSMGVEEVLAPFKPIEIHPQDIKKFVRHQKHQRKQIYKIVFNREEKFRSKKGVGFYFEEYLRSPKLFESNLDEYLPHLTALIHCSYWDSRYPRLVTEKMIKTLYRKKKLKLSFIGDLTCDKKGAIELTRKVTDPDHPVFTYDPMSRSISDGLLIRGVSILAVDNLPAEFPKDSSEEFASMIRDYLYQIAAHGATDITNHHALAAELRSAVITQAGRLTKDYQYLRSLYKI